MKTTISNEKQLTGDFSVTIYRKSKNKSVSICNLTYEDSVEIADALASLLDSERLPFA